MPRGTQEQDSQISKRLQVRPKPYAELFLRRSRADWQHLFFSSALRGDLSLELREGRWGTTCAPPYTHTAIATPAIPASGSASEWPRIAGPAADREEKLKTLQRLRLPGALATHGPRGLGSTHRPCPRGSTNPEIVRRLMRGPGETPGLCKAERGEEGARRFSPGYGSDAGPPDPRDPCGAGGTPSHLSPAPGIATAGEPRLPCHQPAPSGAARGAGSPRHAPGEGKLRHGTTIATLLRGPGRPPSRSPGTARRQTPPGFQPDRPENPGTSQPRPRHSPEPHHSLPSTGTLHQGSATQRPSAIPGASPVPHARPFCPRRAEPRAAPSSPAPRGRGRGRWRWQGPVAVRGRYRCGAAPLRSAPPSEPEEAEGGGSAGEIPSLTDRRRSQWARSAVYKEEGRGGGGAGGVSWRGGLPAPIAVERSRGLRGAPGRRPAWRGPQRLKEPARFCRRGKVSALWGAVGAEPGSGFPGLSRDKMAGPGAPRPRCCLRGAEEGPGGAAVAPPGSPLGPGREARVLSPGVCSSEQAGRSPPSPSLLSGFSQGADSRSRSVSRRRCLCPVLLLGLLYTGNGRERCPVSRSSSGLAPYLTHFLVLALPQGKCVL